MTQSADEPPIGAPPAAQPNVFECRQCHKVFEARTSRAFCPECDSDDVERLTS
jgi:Zn finger protein HypA/HybF involved in hydrogenase expression